MEKLKSVTPFNYFQKNNTKTLEHKNLWWRIKNAPFFIKVFNWEYWPIWFANIPVVFIWLWFALRARQMFFFSTANPAIETGGVFGESKINILNRIPEKYLPKTIFIEKNTDFQLIIKKVKEKDIEFPLIAKPNIGERGLLVSKIENENQLKNYATKNQIDFLIQEFVDLPIELAVMHHRFPDEKNGKVTSICLKKSLQVEGDGQSSVRELMAAFPRAILQLTRFEKLFSDILNNIPRKGEILELEPIGNHCRGTTFLNGNHFITPKLEAVFNEISAEMDDIFYGRFDMKCASPEAVENGDFRILEYNGVAAEPAHIYDPEIPVWKKYRDIYRHWKIIFEIYKQQETRGVKSMTWKEVKSSWKEYQDYLKPIEL